eukprot:scaffold5273_cov158-Skeletonema_menzelii.AAC.11
MAGLGKPTRNSAEFFCNSGVCLQDPCHQVVWRSQPAAALKNDVINRHRQRRGSINVSAAGRFFW